MAEFETYSFYGGPEYGNLTVDYESFQKYEQGQLLFNDLRERALIFMANRVKSNAAVGCDPEFFIANSKNLIPSCGVIGGTKGAGVPIDPAHPRFKWLEDNVAVELNLPPYNVPENFRLGMAQASVLVKSALKAKGLHPVIKPHLDFKMETLQMYPEAFTFGCEPDFCAYDKNPKEPRQVEVGNFGLKRFAGGHLHLSYNNPHEVPDYVVVMLMDALVGLASVATGRDCQGARRAVYGQAGLFRPKKYANGVSGVEYRTPSNFWLQVAMQANEDIASASYIDQLAHTILGIGRSIEKSPEELSNLFIRLPLLDIKEAINKEDRTTAQEIGKLIHSTGIAYKCDISTGLFALKYTTAA